MLLVWTGDATPDAEVEDEELDVWGGDLCPKFAATGSKCRNKIKITNFEEKIRSKIMVSCPLLEYYIRSACIQNPDSILSCAQYHLVQKRKKNYYLVWFVEKWYPSTGYTGVHVVLF